MIAAAATHGHPNPDDLTTGCERIHRLVIVYPTISTSIGIWL
jgi:hypothetical protein